LLEKKINLGEIRPLNSTWGKRVNFERKRKVPTIASSRGALDRGNFRGDRKRRGSQGRPPYETSLDSLLQKKLEGEDPSVPRGSDAIKGSQKKKK